MGYSTIGLEFHPPITLKIYVGENLNGQILNIVRSVSGTGGWTNDGVVSMSCVVANGLCEFTATKASYYVTSQFAVTTNPVTDVLLTGVTLNGSIAIANGAEVATTRGFQWGRGTEL